jgi:hypothetical protein
MKFTTKPKTLNLIPIGNINFSFNKQRKGKLYVGDIHILHNTSVDIDKETEKALHKLMKEHKTEVLTDGCDFFTTTGEKVTRIEHPSFNSLLSLEENKMKIHNLRFG